VKLINEAGGVAQLTPLIVDYFLFISGDGGESVKHAGVFESWHFTHNCCFKNKRICLLPNRKCDRFFYLHSANVFCIDSIAADVLCA